MTGNGEPRFGLTARQVELQSEARGFAVEELRPRAAVMEWEAEPARRVGVGPVGEGAPRGWVAIRPPPGCRGGRGNAACCCVHIWVCAMMRLGFCRIHSHD